MVVLRNVERKIVDGSAIQNSVNIGTRLGVCPCCHGACGETWFIPSQPNGVKAHKACLNAWRGLAEVGKNSKSADVKVAFTCNLSDEARVYLAHNNIFSCEGNAFTSAICHNRCGINKVLSGLVAYGYGDVAIFLDFSNGRKIRCTMSQGADVMNLVK